MSLHSAWLVLASVDFADVEALHVAGDWSAAGSLLADEARRLEGPDRMLVHDVIYVSLRVVGRDGDVQAATTVEVQRHSRPLVRTSTRSCAGNTAGNKGGG